MWAPSFDSLPVTFLCPKHLNEHRATNPRTKILSHPKLVSSLCFKGKKLFPPFCRRQSENVCPRKSPMPRRNKIKKRMQKVQMRGICSNLPVFPFSFAGRESDWGPLPLPEVCNIWRESAAVGHLHPPSSQPEPDEK